MVMQCLTLLPDDFECFRTGPKEIDALWQVANVELEGGVGGLKGDDFTTTYVV